MGVDRLVLTTASFRWVGEWNRGCILQSKSGSLLSESGKRGVLVISAQFEHQEGKVSMKRMLVVSMTLNLLVVAAVLLLKVPNALAEGEGGAASCPALENGNVNGDAGVDLSDAVSLLSYLFLGGIEPVPRYVADYDCHVPVQAELAACQVQASVCVADLGTCQTERSSCISDLGVCQTEKDRALADLAACRMERDTAVSERDTALSERDAARAERDALLSNLGVCQADRDNCLTSLAICQSELARCVQPPATGQTACYDVAGAVIECASAAYPGQDGFHRAGCPTAGRFVDNQDGTVTDTCTGLMWEKNSAPGNYLWQSALQYCDRLEVAGHTDWRLPNLRELRTLVDYGGQVPAIDPVFQAIAEVYWTSSTYNVDPTHAWTVGFQDGEGNAHEAKVDPFPVRAVRGGQ